MGPDVHPGPARRSSRSSTRSLTPGAIALAWSRARWPLFLFGAGAVAIPVQATGITTTDLADVGPFSPGQWTVLVVLFVGLAAVYVLQAGIVFRVARSGRRDRAEADGAPPRCGRRRALDRGGGAVVERRWASRSSSCCSLCWWACSGRCSVADLPPRRRPGRRRGHAAARCPRCTLYTSDGLELGAWFLPGPDADARRCFVANGNGGHRGMRAPLARALGAEGLAVLLFDYRGYGGNPGSPSEAGWPSTSGAAREFLLREAHVPPTGCSTSARASARRW